MTRQTQIYILLAATLGVGGILYFNQKKESAVVNESYGNNSKTSTPQITVVPEQIDKLTVKSKDKPEVVLEKKNGNWEMTAPHATAKIEKKAIDDVLNGLKGITFKESIAKGKDNFADKDLIEGKAIHVVASKGGAAVIDVWFGKAPSAGQLARLTGDENIYVINGTGASSFTYDKGEKDFRDKKVWDLPKDQIASVTLKDGKGDFTFVKNDAPAAATDAGAAGDSGDASAAAVDAGAPPGWLGTSSGAPMVGLDASKVDDLINAFALGGVLNADDFGDGKSDTETGLTAPDATTLTFKMKDGATRKILLGKSDGTKRYARTEQEPSIVYLLAEGPSGWADVGVDKFVPAPVGGADAGADAKADAKK